jgi:hypothetical protein
VGTNGAVGLANREFRDLESAAASASAASKRGAVGAAVLSGAATARRRRGLRATSYKPSGSTAQSTPSAPDYGGGAYSNGGAGPNRPIRGTNSGFDGIGVPETSLNPQDLGIAVGATAAIHTANGLMRFYRVDAAGKKAKASTSDSPESSSFLKQVWAADFFYAVRGRALGQALTVTRLI